MIAYLTHTLTTVFGAVTAPDGYYLLPEGAVLADGDLDFTDDRQWHPVRQTGITVSYFTAFTYARRLPEAPAQRSGKWAWSTDEENWNGYMILNAAAAQQAEALGQALGLWKEGE